MPIYPRAVNGIESHVLFSKKGGDVYSIGSLAIDKYIFMSEKQANSVMLAICYMDGKSTIEEIQEKMLFEQHSKVNVEQLCGILAKGGLLEHADEMVIKKEFDEIKTLFVTLRSFSLDKVFGLLCRIPFSDKFMFGFLFLSAVASAIMLLQSPTLTFSVGLLISEPRVIIYYLIVSTTSILLHEFSHAIIGVYYGLKPSTLTVSLYAYVSPMIYIKLPGIYFLPPKKRLITWLAGVTMNLSLLLLSYSASLHTSGEWHLVFVTAAYCNLMIIIFSLNPLLYSDGYYVFSTLLKMPNLRKSSSKSILKIMTGKAKSEDIVYGIYFAIVLTLATLFVIPELYHTIVSTILRIQEGMTVWEVIRQFANVFIMLALGVFASLFAKRTKKRDVDIGTHEEV